MLWVVKKRKMQRYLDRLPMPSKNCTQQINKTGWQWKHWKMVVDGAQSAQKSASCSLNKKVEVKKGCQHMIWPNFLGFFSLLPYSNISNMHLNEIYPSAIHFSYLWCPKIMDGWVYVNVQWRDFISLGKCEEKCVGMQDRTLFFKKECNIFSIFCIKLSSIEYVLILIELSL